MTRIGPFFALLALLACSPSSEEKTQYELELAAEPISSAGVRFTVDTNAPTPIEVMADVTLAGLRDDDTWIGLQKRVTLDKPSSTFVLDAEGSEKPLPKGRYVAEVSYYQRWGAEKNPAANSVPDMSAQQTIELQGSGQLASDAMLEKKRQRWVMENVVVRTPWDEARFVEQLGRYEKSQSTMSRLHDAYYFPGADMTLIVNRLRGEVTIWRMGKTTE